MTFLDQLHGIAPDTASGPGTSIDANGFYTFSGAAYPYWSVDSSGAHNQLVMDFGPGLLNCAGTTVLMRLGNADNATGLSGVQAYGTNASSTQFTRLDNSVIGAIGANACRYLRLTFGAAGAATGIVEYGLDNAAWTTLGTFPVDAALTARATSVWQIVGHPGVTFAFVNTAPTISSVVLSPATSTQSGGVTTQTYTGTATMSDGTTRPITAADGVFSSDIGSFGGAFGVFTDPAATAATQTVNGLFSVPANTATFTRTVPAHPPVITGVTVTPTSPVALAVGDVLQLSATVQGQYNPPQSVTYTSGDPTIATVSNAGRISALKAGSVTVTVTASDNVHVTSFGVVVLTVSVNADPVALANALAPVVAAQLTGIIAGQVQNAIERSGGLVDLIRLGVNALNTNSITRSDLQGDVHAGATGVSVDLTSDGVAHIRNDLERTGGVLQSANTNASNAVTQAGTAATTAQNTYNKVVTLPNDTTTALMLSDNWQQVSPSPTAGGTTTLHSVLPDGRVIEKVVNTDAGSNVVKSLKPTIVG